MARVQILSSVYYPHNQLGVLAKDGILPIIDLLHTAKKINTLIYFLSTYKGENIVLLWYLDKKDQVYIKRLIENKINEFLSKFKSEHKDDALPLNRIFLNISPNTLHFWDHDPFMEWHLFDNNEEEEIRISAILSELCLLEVSKIKDPGSEEIIHFYFRLLMIFLRVNIKSGPGLFPDFIENFLKTIKEMKHDSIMEINQIQKTAQERYRQSKGHYADLFELISRVQEKIDINEESVIFEKWILVIQEALKIKRMEKGGVSEEFMTQLFIVISQKISLRIENLITSFVIFNESKAWEQINT